MNAPDLFLEPRWWPSLLLGPLAVAWLLTLWTRRNRSLDRLLGARRRALSPRSRRGVIGAIAFGAAVVLAGVALMRPAWGASESDAEQRGVDILVCLDVSRSMLARDQAPSRLDAARAGVSELAERARGDRLGLVLFAGEARLATPLTQDLDALTTTADSSGPLDVGLGGTELGRALERALAALPDGDGEHETILLLTDGEDRDGSGLRAARACAEGGVTVHCVGFGSRFGGKIPVEGADGSISFLRDRGGDEVVTAMDEPSLRRIAEATGGTFIAAIDEPSSLVRLYEERIAPMARKSFADGAPADRADRFQLPLAAAFLLWILELCVTVRRSD